jgi:hypothetical protein
MVRLTNVAAKRSEEPMAPKGKGQKTPTKSREWIEAECVKLARQVLGGREIERVTIRRLKPRGPGPNWKVADLIPQPALLVSERVRAKLARLPDDYTLDDQG